MLKKTKTRIGPFLKGTYTHIYIYTHNTRIEGCFLILALPRSPGGFGQLRKACRNHLHLFWYLFDAVVTNYS